MGQIELTNVYEMKEKRENTFTIEDYCTHLIFLDLTRLTYLAMPHPFICLIAFTRSDF